MTEWLSTGNYLVVSIGSRRPITLEIGSEKYAKVLPLLKRNASDEEILAQLDVVKKIESYGQGEFSVDGDAGTVMIDGVEVHDCITERIVEFARKQLPYLPLLNFWRNIQQNPSEESKAHLFFFLEANKMVITHDGCFLAYKGVNRNRDGNLVDAYTGNFCNNIGAVVTMDREKVDPARNCTCSKGLHVAAFDYVWNIYNQNIKIEVKVNPRDVVAVPSDYNNQKMRVCRYEVVSLNAGKEIDPEAVPLLDQSTEKSMRRNSQKTEGCVKKASKKALRAEMAKIHVDKLEELKTTQTSGEISLDGFTGNEIIEIVVALHEKQVQEGWHEAMYGEDVQDLTNMNRKNKKSIVRKASSLLTSFGFKIV
jgi:hypothetical protein